MMRDTPVPLGSEEQQLATAVLLSLGGFIAQLATRRRRLPSGDNRALPLPPALRTLVACYPSRVALGSADSVHSTGVAHPWPPGDRIVGQVACLYLDLFVWIQLTGALGGHISTGRTRFERPSKGTEGRRVA
jgi:hypothetical protein